MKVYRPQKGFEWNPLLKLPRNMACPCGSKKKFKTCCLPAMLKTVETAGLKAYEAAKQKALAGEVAW